MGRHSCSVKLKLRKGFWSPEEDEKLYNHITRFGVGCWSSVPKLAGLQRCGKSCRLRWINYLRPDLKRGMFSEEEEDLIISLHKYLGNRWAQIATKLPGRTDNEIKNFWNSCLKKKLIKRGIDPNTHVPVTEIEVKKETDSADSASLQILQTNGLPSLSSPVKDYHFQVQSVGEPAALYDQTIFLPEFEPTSNLRPLVAGNLIVNDGCGFSSMPHLTNFSDCSSSRMSAFLINEVKFDGSAKNMMENGNGFSWDSDNKLESMFQFQFSEIQIEDRKDASLFENQHSSEFCDYPEFSGESLDVFQNL